ncbi:MAG: ABC transporter permease subunit [Betaproteobacteria bacterium]|nr:ABC transporter permease subunit [Betaproteobacteria bacterium]
MFALRALSVVILLILWEAMSRIVSADILPSLARVVTVFFASLDDGYVWSDMAITGGRVVAAFALSMSIALTLGMALGTVRWFGRMFDFWVTIAAAVPSILYIVVAYLWLGLNDVAAIAASAVVVAPSATFNIIQGVKAIDPGLSEMARAFRVPSRSILWRVLLPQTLPYLFAAARTGLALTWKIVIFVELMGRSSGVGYRIQYFYSLFNMERVLASALPFMMVMLLIELVVIRRLEAYLFRWRREEAR